MLDLESWGMESGVESWILARLLTGTLHGAAVIAVVWVVCRRFQAIPASVQAGLWWLASLKLLLVFLPLPTIALPLLPAPELPLAAGLVFDRLQTPATRETVPWLAVVVACWTTGLLVQVIRLALAFRRVRGLVGRAAPLPASDGAIASDLARAVGLRRCPEVRLSAEIAGPLVSGIVRPVALLPATLPRADWSIAICHEFVHVRRHDLVLGWVPALAERLFFFHPLARLAAREYITAREAACDAGVLRVLGVPAGDYGRLLVRLGVAHAEPVPAAGGAPTSMASLRRRLNMLQHLTPQGPSRHLPWLLAAALAVTLVPFELSARQAPATAPAAASVAQAIARPVELAPSPTPAQPAPAARPVARAASPQAAAPAAPSPREVFLDQLKLVEASKRNQDALSPELFKLVESSTLIAEQKDRVARAQQEQEEVRRAEAEFAAQQQQAVAAMDAAEAEMRRQEGSTSEEYRKAVAAQANAMVEQANRLARVQEREVRRQQETTEAFLRQQRDELSAQIAQLRVQQEEMTRQLRILAEQQKELTETSKNLARETERLGNAVNPPAR